MVTTSVGGTTAPLMLAAGTLLSVISVALMVYAYRTFVWRANRIRERLGGRTDDPTGPSLLAGAMLLAIAICIGVIINRGHYGL